MVSKEFNGLIGALFMIVTVLGFIFLYIDTRDFYLSIIIYLVVALFVGSLSAFIFRGKAWNSFLLTSFFFLFIVLPLMILELLIFLFSNIMGLFSRQISGVHIMDTLIPGLIGIEIVIMLLLLPLGLSVKFIQSFFSEPKSNETIFLSK